MNDRHYEKMSEAELSKKLGQYQKQARIWTIIGLVGVLGGVISFFSVDDMALKSILTAVLFFGGVCAALFLGGGAQKKLKALMQEQMGDFFRAELENAFGPDMHTAQMLIDEKLVRSLRLLDGQWEEIETENFREGEHNGAHFSAANVRLNHVYERGAPQDGLETCRDMVFKGIPYLRLDADTPWQKTILSDVSKMYEQLSDRAAPLMLQSRIFDIWHTIYVNTKQERKVTSSASPQLSILKDMLSLIHNGYGEKVTLNKIADAGKISISNCNVIFKKYLKESPIKYLLNYRLMKSTELLVENALPITEVAFEVGFSNPSYFIDAFKKAYGLTPNEYRKKFRASETFDPYADI